MSKLSPEGSCGLQQPDLMLSRPRERSAKSLVSIVQLDGWFAGTHVFYGSELLGDDPRYQAPLGEAGITW